MNTKFYSKNLKVRESLEDLVVDGESGIKIGFKVVFFDDINRIHPTQDRVQYRPVQKMVMKFPIVFRATIVSQEGPCTVELISWTSVSRLHGSLSKDEVSEDDRRFIP